jgi:hypothetical protein
MRNKILNSEQIKSLKELGVTIPDEVPVSLSDMINLLLSKGCLVKLEPQGDEDVFARSGCTWCIREDAVSAVHALLCQLITGGKIAPEGITFK